MGEQGTIGKAEIELKFEELKIEEARKKHEIEKALAEFEDTKESFCLECGFNPNEVVLEFDPMLSDPSRKHGTLKLGGDLQKSMKTERILGTGDDVHIYKLAVIFFNESIYISMRAIVELGKVLNKCHGEEYVRQRGYLLDFGLYVEGSGSAKGVMISARRKNYKGSFEAICSVERETLTEALEELGSSGSWDV